MKPDARERVVVSERGAWVQWLPAAAAGAVLGWVAHDLVSLAASREPQLALRLLPSSAIAVLLGFAVGLASRRSVWPIGLVATAALAGFVVPRALGVESPPELRLVSMATLGLLLCCGLAVLVQHRYAAHPFAVACAAGGVLAAVLFLARVEVQPASIVVLACGALVLLASPLRAGRVRLASRAVAVLGIAAFTAHAAHRGVQLRRPDLPHTAPPPGASPPNLILITLDTVRADHLAPYGYARVTTPRLDAWVRRHCDVYLDARSTSSWTLPAHASMLTGLYPAQHGAVHPRGERAEVEDRFGPHPAQRLRDDVPTLAEELAKRGYRTGAIVANKSYLAHEFGLDRGFQHYDDRPGARAWIDRIRSGLVQFAGFQRGIGRRSYRDAETITDLALAWLRDATPGEPFLLFLNYLDAHSPNIPHASVRQAFAGDGVGGGLLALQYDRELLYLDQQLARLLARIDAAPWGADTAVIITSDHGESLGDHGFLRHDATLYDSVLKVPLYVKPAGRAGRGEIAQPASGIEVHRIAREQLGLGPPVPPVPVGPLWLGTWYRSATLQRDVDVDRDLAAWLEGELKYIVSSRGDVEIYDVRADPGELEDLAARPEWAGRVERARRIANAWWAAHPPAGDAEAPDLDDDQLEDLRALGYIE